MPVHARAQVSVWYDSTLPRDSYTVNPCFRHNNPVPDWQSLTDSIATYFQAQTAGTQQVQVKLYDLEGTRPIFPMATKLLSTGTQTASGVCRELAICLSFYHNVNRPRQRGRLYIPLAWLADKTVGLRPSSGQQALVSEYGNGLSAMGGVDVDWGVWSTVDKVFHQATNTWVDDEWDIIRSRGLKSTNRFVATVSG